jgi:hypothetical protein
MSTVKNRWRDKVKKKGVQLIRATTMSFKRIASVMGWKALVVQLYSLTLLKVRHQQRQVVKNLSMNGRNKAQMRHMKTPLEEKTSRMP